MDNQHSKLLGSMRPRGAAIALAVLIAAPELLFFLAELPFGLIFDQAANLRGQAVVSFGFWPGQVEIQVDDGSFGFLDMFAFVTYPFIHLSAVNAVFSILFVLVVHRFVLGLVREVSCLAIFLGSSAFGALGYYFFAGIDFPLIGASPGYLGLFGVAAAIAVLIGRSAGESSLNPIARTVLILPALLIGFEVIASLLFGGRSRWVADLAGFSAGFLLAPLVLDIPYSRLVAKIMQLLK